MKPNISKQNKNKTNKIKRNQNQPNQIITNQTIPKITKPTKLNSIKPNQGWAPPKFWNSIGIPNRWEISNFKKKLEFQWNSNTNDLHFQQDFQVQSQSQILVFNHFPIQIPTYLRNFWISNFNLFPNFFS